MGVRPDGKWVARTAAIVCPRQNGKGGILEALELYWLFLCETDRLVVHSAHRFDTSLEHFIRVRALIENTPSLLKRVASITTSNGKEGITLKDGSRLAFKARSKGSLRGPSPDKIVLDEAFYLWDETLQGMLPARGARPNPQTVYASSSPISGPESDVLRRLCKRGRTGESGLAYLEYSCEPGADVNDEENWYRANPSLGTGLDIETLRDNKTQMSDEAFAMEHLGIWVEDEGAQGAIDMSLWRSQCIDSAGEGWLSGRVAFGVEGNAGGDWVSVVSAGETASGKTGLGLVKHNLGTDWVLPWAIEVHERMPDSVFVFDPKSATADLFLRQFVDAGLPVVECGFTDRALPRATAGLMDDIINTRLEILSNPLLDAAAAGSEKRWLGESWLWDRKVNTVLSPLIAATLARWGLLLEEPEPVSPFMVYA